MGFPDENRICLPVRLCPSPQIPTEAPPPLPTRKRVGKTRALGMEGAARFLRSFHFIPTPFFWGSSIYEKAEAQMMGDGLPGAGSLHTPLTGASAPLYFPPHPCSVPWSLKDNP